MVDKPTQGTVQSDKKVKEKHLPPHPTLVIPFPQRLKKTKLDQEVPPKHSFCKCLGANISLYEIYERHLV